MAQQGYAVDDRAWFVWTSGVKTAGRFDDRLTLRVSVDHYTRTLHEGERGPGSWQPMIEGLQWLTANGFLG